jgi:hypothetical protein
MAWIWGFKVHTEHQGPLGRLQVETHHVTHLVHKGGVAGEFEGLVPMGGQAEGAPNPL